MVAIQDRANAFLDILGRPVPKAIFAIWGAIATWDTFVSQFIPENIAKNFPKAHQVIAMTYGWLSIQTWLLIGAGIVVLTSLEYAARHKWKLELATGGRPTPSSDSARPLLAFFWLFVVTTIVTIWSLDAAHWGAQVSKVSAPALPRPAKPLPSSITTPTPPPPLPPEPWVTEDEVQKAKKSGRLLLPFGPNELARMNYSMGSIGTDAYVGSWVKIDNPFLRVSRLVEKDKKEYLIVVILQPVWPAVLIFDAKKWGDQILTMNPSAGAKVHALCQLVKYDDKDRYDMDTTKFVGANCELQ
ncbi:hypothetical protein [Bradyrhizobium erythrophlei]|jgi:hypothetical protein|uniref:Uncharacterized protein n=1 Tax=Bradyrhizobium erythrophlei TaxID=1437360 RepID=A0A1M5JAC6_9BRAD|nr:hypothetical protein [Bradyrhizobium erythrophlei]SHG37200.1 hypothetical protein SAMN05443248_1316 [Bradyrhizobium erythrophlei]